MKLFNCVFFMLFGVLFTTHVHAEVAGLWKTHKGVSGGYLYVNIAYCDSSNITVCGKIVRAIDPKGNEMPDYIYLGSFVLKDMHRMSKKFWSKGKLWSPEDEKYYNGGVRFIEKSGKLKVTGCVGVLCQNYYWKRVSN